jgi:hypothetical protein
MVLDKKLLVDGKSIRQEKDRGKEKSRVEWKGVESIFFSIQEGIYRGCLEYS